MATESHRELFHVIDAMPFDRALLDELCELTTAVRTASRTKDGAKFLQGLLPDKRAMLYFTQPSTRTFLSFNNACQILGMGTSEIRDPTVSSEVKGETFEDSIRTFSSYVDVIIMRTKERGLAQRAAELMDSIPRRIPIINAGSGPDQHPTQALLDIYTLARSFKDRGGIDGKVIGMMGDLKRGRTVRSLSHLMRHYKNARLVFIAPEAFKMADDIKAYLAKYNVKFQETSKLREALPELDAIYVTRIQFEHDTQGDSRNVDLTDFSITPALLPLLKPHAVIMHPLPRREEIHPDVDRDPRAMYWRQERNGMWMRVALLIKVFGLEGRIKTAPR
ncbi:MAG: aspartate carbamoyltransferase [Pseudomonadota bacterium]